MKIKLLIFFTFIFSTLSFSQKNTDWKNTFIYGVKLPEKLDDYSGIYINIKYKNEPLISTSKKIGGKSTKIETEFIYNAKESNIIGNLKLPFKLQNKTYFWLIDSTLLTEMKTFPELYKIEVITTNPYATKKYTLPETFNLLSQNAMNVEVLRKLSESKRNQEFIKHISILSVQEKKSELTSKTIIDSLLVVDAYKIEKIPVGLLPYFNENCASNKHNHHCEVEINNAYFFNNNLWIPTTPKGAEEKKPPKGADIATIINLTTLDGEKFTCRDGGITIGNCIIKLQKAKKYKITVEFEQ